MTQQLTLTTDPSIPLPYFIDGVPYPHPTTIDLLYPTGFRDPEDIYRSEQMQDALDLGYITIVNEIGENITDLQNQVGASAVGRIIVSNSATPDDLEVGWFPDLTPGGPAAYGIKRRSGLSGYFTYMPHTTVAQIMACNPNSGVQNSLYIDVEEYGDLFLNVLNTGIVGTGRVIIGKGEGLVVLSGFDEGVVTSDSSGVLTSEPLPVFGQNYQKAERTDEQSTGSTTFQNYLTLTTPSIPAGEYIVNWFMVTRRSNTGADFSARVQVDDTIDLVDPANGGSIQVEHKDSGTNQRVPYSSHNTFTTLSAGTHTIDIDYREQGGGTSYVFHAVLTMWRVA